MNTNNNTNTNSNTIMKGGFGFGNKGMVLKGKYKFKNVVKNTKRSEMNLMNAYEDMDSKIKKYNKSYAIHLENIKVLDDYLNFNGIETLFKKVIMVDNFVKGHIDKANPLLFNNYKIKGELLPSEMRKAHLLTQVTFIMSKSISGSDQTFIKDIYVTDISKKEFVLVIITIDNLKDKKIIPHTDYLVDKTKVKEFIKEIISDTKKKLQRSSKIAYFNGANHSIKLSKSSKTKTATKRNTKNSNNYLKISNKKSGNVKSKSKHTKKSEITSKLSEYMTDFEKIRKAEKIKEEKQKAEAEAKAKQYAPAPRANNKRGGILGQDYTPITTGYPAPPGIQEQYQRNEVEAKCRSFGQDMQRCNENAPECFFDRNKGCKKNNPNFVKNPMPYQRNPYPAPNIGENPYQNPFTVQPQQPRYQSPEPLL